MASPRIKRLTYAQLVAAALSRDLAEGEPYLITDQNRFALGLSTGTYQLFATATEAGGAFTQVTLNVAAVSQNYAEVVVADASVTTSSKLLAQLVGDRDAENDAESIGDDNITLLAVPETNQVRFILQSIAWLFGPFRVNYKVFG